MKFMILLTVLFSSTVFAGGSAYQSDILAMVKQETRSFLVSNFELEEVGSCLRLGEWTGRGGERVLPCSIEGKMKNSDISYSIELDSDGDIEAMMKN